MLAKKRCTSDQKRKLVQALRKNVQPLNEDLTNLLLVVQLISCIARYFEWLVCARYSHDRDTAFVAHQCKHTRLLALSSTWPMDGPTSNRLHAEASILSEIWVKTKLRKVKILCANTQAKITGTRKRNAYHLVCSYTYSEASRCSLIEKKVDMQKIACLNHHMIVNVRCASIPVISALAQIQLLMMLFSKM